MWAGMRVTREKLIFLALSVLTQWSARAAKGPVRPDMGVRFALTFLYTCGKSRNRGTYDDFWRLLSDPGGQCMHDSQRNYIRGTYCDSCLKGIILDVGAPMTPEFSQALSDAARGKRELASD